MNTKFNLAELIRHIQKLANLPEFTEEELQEYEFYLSLFSVINQIILPGFSENLVLLPLKRCPFEKAEIYADKLGLRVIEGKPGTIYVTWAK